MQCVIESIGCSIPQTLRCRFFGLACQSHLTVQTHPHPLIIFDPVSHPTLNPQSTEPPKPQNIPKPPCRNSEKIIPSIASVRMFGGLRNCSQWPGAIGGVESPLVVEFRLGLGFMFNRVGTTTIRWQFPTVNL